MANTKIKRDRLNFGSLPAFRAELSSATAIADNTYTTIVFDTERFDTGGNYNNTTGVFTAPEAGVYQFNAVLRFDTMASGENVIIVLFVNDQYARYSMFTGTGSTPSAQISESFYMDAGDTARVYAYQNDGAGASNNLLGTASTGYVTFSGHKIG